VSVDKLTASLIHAEPFQRRKSPLAADVIVTSPRSFKLDPDISPEKYVREFQAVDPVPIFNFLVSVSKPHSPTASVGFTDVQDAAKPLLN
jgi:hypothetical protein